MKVTRLRASDALGEAEELLIRFFEEEGFETMRSIIAANLRTMAGLESCAILVASDDGVSTGVATVSLDFGIEFGWSGEMGDLYVVPEWRGRGVARALVEAAEAVLKEKGCAGYQVTVTPHAAEQGLAAFYEALGFGSEGRAIYFKAL
ncbi:MAG: GNAT family N-acetyltransferase [Aestuariivirga sp.]